jgi:hypothetical protein
MKCCEYCSKTPNQGTLTEEEYTVQLTSSLRSLFSKKKQIMFAIMTSQGYHGLKANFTLSGDITSSLVALKLNLAKSKHVTRLLSHG